MNTTATTSAAAVILPPPVGSVWTTCDTCDQTILIAAASPRECAICRARRTSQQRASSFLRDESGQDVVEYSLLLVMIGAAALIVITMMGNSISSIFSKLAGKLNEADGAIK